jgi:hypothetical protein
MIKIIKLRNRLEIIKRNGDFLLGLWDGKNDNVLNTTALNVFTRMSLFLEEHVKHLSKKNAPNEKSRRLKCFHNGIILIVN